MVGPVVQGRIKPVLGKASETGFAPGVLTNLPIQSLEETYLSTSGMSLQIPAINLNMPVLGIPLVNREWDASWLGTNAGWLSGTAFPGMDGNSVILGHVYLANGLPGPMINLDQLKWGDKIIVTNGGEQLIYKVQSVSIVDPNDRSILAHSSEPVLTLVTCKGYDPTTGHYRKRLVVRAELTGVNSLK